MTRFLYVATDNSSCNYSSLGKYEKDEKRRIFGYFIKGKPYICWTNNKGQLQIGGFFNMEAEIEQLIKGKPSKWVIKPLGLGYYTLDFEKATALKFLKYVKTIKNKQK